jgi:hypothetical protein
MNNELTLSLITLIIGITALSFLVTSKQKKSTFLFIFDVHLTGHE